MTKSYKILLVHFFSMFSAGCFSNETYTIQIHEPLKVTSSNKQIALFLDGTQNNRDSRTNVAVLSEIVKHQDKDNLYMFYNEGVGTDAKFVGAATGLGIDKDVKEAYTFLAKYYSPKSKLYIFGFSRGAYTSRILAGMIYSVGIYNLNPFKKEDREEIVGELYTAYKGKYKKISDIKISANNIIEKWEKKLANTKSTSRIEKYDDVKIEIMGLWDTVEALGLIPTFEALLEKILGKKDPQNFVYPNARYMDQICNIKKIYHALSLDDNRANVFTPIIMSNKHVTIECPAEQSSIATKVDEVWFSGAHADVGGGGTKRMKTIKRAIIRIETFQFQVSRLIG